MAKLSIIGAGGHSRSLINLLEDLGWQINGIYDDAPLKLSTVLGIQLKGSTDYIPPSDSIVLAIGNNFQREKLYFKYQKQVLKASLIHKRAIVALQVMMGNSNQVFAGAIINANATLGDNNIINTGSIIEHDCIIGSHNHISIGSIISGSVKIGNRCLIGAGATIINNISICDDVIIGANATVLSNIIEPGTYVGTPARLINTQT